MSYNLLYRKGCTDGIPGTVLPTTSSHSENQIDLECELSQCSYCVYSTVNVSSTEQLLLKIAGSTVLRVTMYCTLCSTVRSYSTTVQYSPLVRVEEE